MASYISVKPSVTINCRSSVTVDEGKDFTVDEGEDFTVDEGEDFTCVCRGENGNPPADVTWYKDNVQTGTREKEEQTLTRSNVNVTDDGTYKCKAQSHTLTEEKSIVIKVRPNAKPNVTGITFEPNPVEVGKTVTITCVESEGVPEPSYITSHNGEVVGSKKMFTISVKRSDQGPYTCVAQNKLGSHSATANLTVVEQRSTTKPPSTSTPTSKKQGNGEDTTTDDDGGGGLSVGAIVGIVIGVLVLLIIIIIVVVWRCKLKESKFCR
ncbi:Neogenin [Paramuricea clavata]|uniref:Neogenin n=1 Tax=Paramuricea clavata TaxID=317549 RepID=A0A6S7H5M0_PARCT|nr:Neogenin [Paramuricea clavata]